jgi:hypothetical protein
MDGDYLMRGQVGDHVPLGSISAVQWSREAKSS